MSDNRDEPEPDMNFKFVSMEHIYEGWTDEQRQRLENAAETAYRRGFCQGASTVSEVVSNARVDKWLDGVLYSWRYSGKKFVVPPSIPRRRPNQGG